MQASEGAGPSRILKRKRKDTTPSLKRPSRASLKAQSKAQMRAPSPEIDEEEESQDLRLQYEIEPEGVNDEDSLPVRMLNNFYVFEHKNGQRTMRSLDEYETRELCATGSAIPYLQKDADDEESDDEEIRTHTLQTTPVKDLYVQYLEYDRLIWIETEHAWYVLCEPCVEYEAQHRTFAHKHIGLQLLCSMAAHSDATIENYCKAFSEQILHRPCTRSDLEAFMGLLLKLSREPDNESILQVPLIHAICTKYNLDTNIAPSSSSTKRKRRPIVYRESPRQINVDARALRSERLTAITSFVDAIRKAYHPSWSVDIEIVNWDSGHSAVFEPNPTDDERKHLLQCVKRARSDTPDGDVRFPKRNKDGDIVSISVGKEIYQVGDVVVFFPRSSFNDKMPDPLPENDQDIPPNARLEDFNFWFGRLEQIKQPTTGKPVGHIVWFEHASRTFVGAGADPRELVLWTRQCGDQPLGAIHGKVNVLMMHEDGIVQDLPPEYEYFCRFGYEEGEGYRSLPTHIDLPQPECTNCSAKEQQTADEEDEPISVKSGFRLRGQSYHVDDFCLFKSSSNAELPGSLGLARIGRIVSFSVRHRTLQLVEFGRIADFKTCLSSGRIDRVWDDRQLFAGAAIRIALGDVVGPCCVLHHDSIIRDPDYRCIPAYIAASASHFWAIYKNGNGCMQLKKPGDLVALETTDFPPCSLESTKARNELANQSELFRQVNKAKLKCLDLCSGTGALGLGIRAGSQETLEITHAVEIASLPSETMRINHPETQVYNICINTLLSESVRFKRGEHGSYLDLQATDGSRLPDVPPQPDSSINTIVAGFPCQPHSGLNAFKRKQDRKADLLLSVLSWIHFIRPDRVVLENVRGFMRFSVDGAPSAPEVVRGSGLRFLVNVLMRLGYQVQFYLLNAVHYGAPQRRIRFLLFAAKIGVPLISVPTPTHYHPSEAANLSYTHSNAEGQDFKLSTVDARRYQVPLRYVSVEDALGDLMPWDLASSTSSNYAAKKKSRSRDTDDLIELRANLAELLGGMIKEFSSKSGRNDTQVGPSTKDLPARLYVREPHSTFQETMRPPNKEVRDLQHFSAKMSENMTELVGLVPLLPGADWQSIPDVETLVDRGLGAKEWKRGTIGQIDKDTIFQTIVTNVHPSAKQGWVLHPWCRRMLSVRELARAQGFPDWFYFHAPNVKAMHTQIGNAVPWPLGQAIGRALFDAEFKKWCEDGMHID